MDFETLVRTRRSVRGYKPDPVPKQVIQEIIDVAKGAPSSMNTQPWNLYVVTGEPLDKIRAGNTERMLAGVKPQRDFPTKEAYEGIHRERQVEIAKQLFAAMGIARDDKEMRQDWVMRGFRQFDAPVSIVLTYDKILEPAAIGQFDLGAISYAICLAAWERGLGTVINGQGVMQTPVVREHAGIPDTQAILTCIAMGYPNDDFSANQVKSTRADEASFVNFVGFDD
ncbi:MAG: nitroreductase [Gammaproteobacteria bacterium]|jgi:nitroreductase|nr:nitroreductase [Gammaproteobacteria bacterium]